MTAALATAPTTESATTDLQRTGDPGPQHLSGSRASTAPLVQSVSVQSISVQSVSVQSVSVQTLSVPSARAVRAQAGPARAVQEIQSVPSRREPLPYLDSVPVSEPPFDDEIAAAQPTRSRVLRGPGEARATPSVDGRPTSQSVGAASAVTAPTITRRRTTPATTGLVDPPSTTGRRTAIGASGVPSWSSESDVGVRRTSTQALPPAMRTGQVFARALVEILSGRRSLAQLRVHCSPDIYAGLLDRPVPAAVCLPHLLTVRVCEPADGVAEVSAAFRRAQRVRAIAFRIQGVDGRWRITALEVG